MNPKNTKYLIRRQVAELLGRSVSTVDRYISEGKLIYVKNKGIARKDVLAILKEQQKPPAKQELVRNAIIQLYIETGDHPRVRDIQDAANLSSSSLVNLYISKLMKEGFGERYKNHFVIAGLRDAVRAFIKDKYMEKS